VAETGSRFPLIGGKTIVYPSGAAHSASLKLRLFGLPTNIRLGLKGVAVANTLACFF